MVKYIDANSFIGLVDHKNLSQDLKIINEKLIDINFENKDLIISIDNIRKLMIFLPNLTTKSFDDIKKRNFAKDVVVIHQGLYKIIVDKEIDLPDDYLKLISDAIQQLTIFYPIFIFNNEIVTNKTQEEV